MCGYRRRGILNRNGGKSLKKNAFRCAKCLKIPIFAAPKGEIPP